MKQRVMTLSLFCLLIGGMQQIALGQDRKEQLEEANRSAQQALELHNAGSDAEAAPLAERALAIREKTLGAEHHAVANSLNLLAMIYRGQGDYARAEQFFRRALAILEKKDTNSIDLATVLNNLASLYLSQRDYGSAEPLARRGLEIRERALGVEHLVVAKSLEVLAPIYQAQGDYGRAEQLYKRALAIFDKEDVNNIDVATVLNNLSYLYFLQGDYGRAGPLAQRALPILEKTKGGWHPDVAKALNNLAFLYLIQGDPSRAEPLAQRALEIIEKAKGTEHPDVAIALKNLANIYRARGASLTALPLARRALAILEKAKGPEDPDVAVEINDLAILYYDVGDYGHVEPLYQRALEIIEKVKGPENRDVAGALNNLAYLYLTLGDYRRAKPLYQRALAILEKSGAESLDVATALSSLAGVHREEHDYGRAEQLYQRALAIYEKIRGAEHPDVATVLNNLSYLYILQNDYDRAEPLAQRVLMLREKALGTEHPDVAEALITDALICQGRGDYGQAETLCQRALAILEKAKGPEHPSVAAVFALLAKLYQARGEYERALSFLQHEGEVREKNIALILNIGSQQQKQIYLNKLFGDAHAAVSLHVQVMPENADASRLALTMILQRKGRALDAFTTQLESLRRRAAPEDQKLLDQLAAIRSQLATLQLSGGGIPPAARQAEVVRLGDEQERLEDVISRRSTDVYSTTQPITLDAVRQALPADAALVEIFVYYPFNAKMMGAYEWHGAPRYVAYVLRRSDVAPLWVELGEAATIDAEVGRLRDALRTPQRADVRTLARAVDERVMRPIRKLVGPGRRLFLSPDGVLNLIPFAALVDENGKYLVENYSITYLTTGRDLLRLQTSTESRGSPIVIANPLYDIEAATRPRLTSDRTKSPVNQKDANRREIDFTALNYKPLPGTAEEATALTRLWPDAQVLMQEKATESALKQVHGPRVLHIATHGFFLPDETHASSEGDSLPQGSFDTLGTSPLPARLEDPLLRSGLLLAGVKQQQSGAGEDGVLTALETASLDLWGTKLAVLSACETGLGDVRNGAGVYGLRRALVLAGSESQVMSLWKVSDSGTRDLMTAYYTRLQAGEGRTEALRQVQLAMLRGELTPAKAIQRGRRETGDTLNDTPKDYRHPFYWAAFIQSGDWRNMDGK